MVQDLLENQPPELIVTLNISMTYFLFKPSEETEVCPWWMNHKCFEKQAKIQVDLRLVRNNCDFNK